MLRWDIFCRVIDNFGDIGVCWRLSAALAARGHRVRLWVDDASALAWMAPHEDDGGRDGVEVRNWQPEAPMPADAPPGDVVIEAFGCEVDHAWITINSIALCADSMPADGIKGSKKTLRNPIWINLEYLSAESYVERSHGLCSPVMAGAAVGLTKWFFYPGFTEGTGGLIRDREAVADLPSYENASRISLFCYESPALLFLIEQLAQREPLTQLIVLAGRGQKAVDAVIQRKNAQLPAWNKRRLLSIQEQSFMTQAQYDVLLQSCDLNVVRGEDSLVRALLTGRAFVWQIYPQADGAHAAKLEAFLDWLQAPPDLRLFHLVWNGLSSEKLPLLDLSAWQVCAQAARARLLVQRDLVSQLLDFVEEKAVAALSCDRVTPSKCS